MKKILGVLLALSLAVAFWVPTVSAQPIGSPCNAKVTITGSVATAKIIAGATGVRFYVCSVVLGGTNAAGGLVGFVEGTGANCGTGKVDSWGATSGAALVPIGSSTAAASVIGVPNAVLFQTTIPGNDLCIVEATQASNGVITFSAF